MVKFYFKKTLLSLAALLCAFAANAETKTIATDLTLDGEAQIWESDIDWATQSLEVVVDLSSCDGSHAGEALFSVGETESNIKTGFSGNVVHLWYGPSSQRMTCEYYGEGKFMAVKDNIAATQLHTIVYSKDGITFDGEQFANDATTSDASSFVPLLALTHIYFGSAYQYYPISTATYKSVKIIDNTTTGIGSVESDNARSFNVYNVNGQMVQQNASGFSALPKGLYIVNGKKVVKK